MTVSNTTSRNQYTATSGQTVFPYTFEIYNKDDVAVLQNGIVISEGTNYTVSGVGNDGGGNITLTVGATAGDVITIYRDMALERETDYQNSGDFLASEVNNDFDRLWLAAQQNDEGNSRAITKPITDSSSISMELPGAALRANKFLSFDATGAPAASTELTGVTIQSGSWTPVYETSLTDFDSITYNTTSTKGKYVKVGSLVFVSFRVYLSSLTLGSASGSISVQGFPFEGEGISLGQDVAPVLFTSGWTNAPSQCIIYRPSASFATRAILYDSSNNLIDVSDMDAANENQISVSACYRTTE